MDPVVHFEMPYDDRDRMAEFYKKSFGWKTEMFGPEMGNYAVANTVETDEETKLPKRPGAINGGFFKKPTSPEGQYPSVVIAVKNVRESMKKVAEAGGIVRGGQAGPEEPDNIPGVGLYCSFIDTEGNRVGMLEPDMSGMMSK